MSLSTEVIFEEMEYDEKKNSKASANVDDSYESCASKLGFATKKCEEAKNCCPGYKTYVAVREKKFG